MSEPRAAKLAFLSEPAPGLYLLNLRAEGEDFYRLEISRGQLVNIAIDGVRMALQSVRLGPESLLPSGPYTEVA